jgi:hypothetical protein
VERKVQDQHQLFLAASARHPNFGEVGGCNASYDPRVSPEKNDDYIGNGFYQRISTHHATQQFDYVIKNNLLYHATASWDRWFMGGTPISAGVNWPDKLWGTDKSGILDKTAGAPNMTFTGNIPYTQLGMQWIGFGFEAINRGQFSNDLTWLKGKHSIKVGYEFRHHSSTFMAGPIHRQSFNFHRLTGGMTRGTTSATGDRLPRSCWGRFRRPITSFRPSPRSTAISTPRLSTTTIR